MSLTARAQAPQRWAGPAMLLAGGLHTASFAPFGWWPLQLLALALLAASVGRASPRQAAWRGGLFGMGWLGSGLWWLYISLHDFGGLHPLLSALAVALLAAFLSSYLALALALWAAWRTGRPATDAGGFAACWLLFELARGQFFTGFPWLASGYAHTDGPLAALAPWVGVYGIGAVAALLAALLAAWGGEQWAQRRPPPPAGPATRPAAAGLRAGPVLGGGALLLLLVQALPAEFTEPAGALRVSLLQPNVPQHLKFDPDRIVGNLITLREQVQAGTGELVVTPESVVPLPRDQVDGTFWQGMLAPFRQPGRAALIGIFTGDEQAGYVNSLVGVSAAPQDYVYGKRHLLPFGEYVPPGFRWFVDLLRIPLGDQAAGTQTAPFEVAGQRVRPLICYEDLFGEDIAASVVGPQAATVLVNATNLAWFGRHMVQDQHLQFSRMRSLEFQRPIARATNTGATALIDHQGVVTHRLPALQQGRLEVTVQGRRGSTPYARWLARLGLWPFWALACAGLLQAAWRRKKTPAGPA